MFFISHYFPHNLSHNNVLNNLFKMSQTARTLWTNRTLDNPSITPYYYTTETNWSIHRSHCIVVLSVLLEDYTTAYNNNVLNNLFKMSQTARTLWTNRTLDNPSITPYYYTTETNWSIHRSHCIVVLRKIIQQRMLVVNNFHVKTRYTYIHFFHFFF